MRNFKKLSLAAVVMFGCAMTASAQRGGGRPAGGGQPSGGGGRPAPAQSAPRVQQSAPRAAPSIQSAPRITQSAPSIQQSAPRIQQAMPSIQSAPRIQQSMPSIQQAAPRITQSAPSIQSAPRITQSTPSIQQPAPRITPTIPQSTPRITQSAPTVQQPSPLGQRPTPAIQQPNVASNPLATPRNQQLPNNTQAGRNVPFTPEPRVANSSPVGNPRTQQLPNNPQQGGRNVPFTPEPRVANNNVNPGAQFPNRQQGVTTSNSDRYRYSPYGGSGASNPNAPVYSRMGHGTTVNNTVNNFNNFNTIYPSTGYYGGYRGYYSPYGYGYGYNFGLGLGYGGISFGYGSGPFRFAISIPLFGGGYGGYGYGGYNSGYVYSQPGYYSYYPTTVVESVPLVQQQPAIVNAPEPVAQQPRQVQPEPADYFTNGQRYLMEGKYAEAIQALRHAAVDMPKSGSVAAVMSQALFANGSFDEAAGAAQQALTLLPENKWVFTLTNTGTMVDTRNSMAELRKQIVANPEAPGLRFLAGYQSFVAKDYKQAVVDLDALNKLVPDEPIATKLRKNALELIK